MLTKVKEYLKGKKTYLVAAAAIITAVVGYSDGTLDLIQLIEAVFVAVGFGTLRAGIAKK